MHNVYLSHVYVPHALSTHLPLFGHPNTTWRRVQIMKVLNTQLSPNSYYFFPLRTQYSSQYCSLSNLILCSSLSVVEQV